VRQGVCQREDGEAILHDSSNSASSVVFSKAKGGNEGERVEHLAGSAKRRLSLSSPWCGLDPSVPMALSKRFKAYRDPEAFGRHGPRWSQRLIWLQVGKYPCLHLTILHKPNVA